MNKVVLLIICFLASSVFYAQKGFVENKGQIADFKGGMHPEILYTYQGNGVNIYFKKEGLSYYFYKNEEVENDRVAETPIEKANQQYAPTPTKSYYYRMDLLFKGGNIEDVQIESSEENQATSNYYYSHCSEGVLGVKTYKTIKYKNIYKNIDFIFNLTEKGIKYDVIVKPGANPKDIHLLYDGASELEKISGTEVLIKTPVIDFTESIPLSFYSESKEEVNCEFVVENNTLTFKIPNYNNRELIIDPVQNWSTYFDYGSTNVNSGRPVFDSRGNMYNARRTQTTGFPLINAGGGQYFDNVVSGTYELVLYKFGQNDNIVWSTYYGGSGSDNIAWPGRALAIDSNEHIYILVNTIGSNFPTFNPGGGAFYQDDTRMYSFYNSALIELDTNGVRHWATIISHESANTNGQDFTVWGVSAKDNKVYITGIASESNGNTPPFRSYPGGYYNTTMVGDVTPFIGRFTNRALDWCTYVNAGSGAVDYNGHGWDVEEDDNGNIFMTGATSVGSASPGHLLVNPGGGAYYQTSSTGGYELLVTKFGSNLQPIWSSYYGGVGLDDYENMTVNSNGELFMVGYTHSSDFPTTNPGGGAYYRASNAMNNYMNSYVVKFDANNAVDWATTYSDSMIFHGVETDANGTIYIYGAAAGNGTNIPTLNEPGSYFDNTHNGGYYDYFITKFDTNGVHQWGTFYGGSGYDAFGISGRSGLNIFSNPCSGTNIVFFGQTNSDDFPTLNPGGGALYQSSRTVTGSTYAPVIVRFTESVSSIIDTNTTSTAAICETGTKTLTATIGTGTWSIVSGGGSITGTTYTPANVSSNTSVTVRYTDLCGNISDRTFMVNVMEIANNTMPTTDICVGDSRTVTGTPSGGTWSEIGAGNILVGSYVPPNLLPGGSVPVSTIYTIAANGACPSTSDTVDFNVVRDSTVTATSSTANMCNGDTRTLTGTPQGGVWSVVSGPGNITGNTLTATGGGTIQVKYRVVGQCMVDSATQSITVTSTITVSAAASSSSLCENLTRTMSGTPSGGSWNVLSGPGTITGGVLTPSGVGTVTIEYSASSSCGNGADTIDVVINPVPNANAGIDENICTGDTVTLIATGGGTYQWTPGPAGASNQVYPIVTTGYRVDVTSDSGCIASDSVTVFVQSTGTATAQNDDAVVVTGVQETIDVYTNDIGGINTIQILSGPSHGTATVSNGNVLYTSTAGYIGNDTLVYEICDANCGVVCDTAIVVIVVENDLTIPVGISPNGDGKNDVFNILGLSRYPNNSIQIFNRWGSLVFQAEPYLNDWAGQITTGSLMGSEVVEGTYFYVLKLGEDLPSYNGYIELKK